MASPPSGPPRPSPNFIPKPQPERDFLNTPDLRSPWRPWRRCMRSESSAPISTLNWSATSQKPNSPHSAPPLPRSPSHRIPPAPIPPISTPLIHPLQSATLQSRLMDEQFEIVEIATPRPADNPNLGIWVVN